MFKLEEIDKRAKPLKPGRVVLDLGAPPGARSPYAIGRIGKSGRAVARDILEMPGLTGVEGIDAPRSIDLAQRALDMTQDVLKAGGMP